MFHFPGCPPARLLIHLAVSRHYPGRVSPFGDPWIVAYLRLTTAFRSLSRPSSAISALASTLRSYSLDLSRNLRSLLRLLSRFGRPGSARWPPASAFHFACLSVSDSLSLCSFQGALDPSPSLGKESWWAEVDSNHRPHAYQACALTC